MGSISKMETSQRVERVRVTWPVHFAKFSVFRFFFAALVLGVTMEGTEAKEFWSNRNVRSCVCEGEYDPNTDYFPDKVKPDLSTLWNVTYHNNYKKVTVKSSSGEVVTTAYLVLCGTPTPEGVGANDQVISIPIQKASVDSTTMFHFFEYIGQRTSLTHYTSGQGRIVNSCLQSMAEQDLIFDSADVAVEKSNVDVLFFSQYTTLDLNTPFPVVLFNEAFETSSLGQAEWVEFMSLFFNREKAANEIVGQKKARFNCHSNKAKEEQEKTIFLFFPWISDSSTMCASLDAFVQGVQVYPRNCEATSVWECDIISAANANIPAGVSGVSNITQAAEFAKDVDVIVMSTGFNGLDTKCQDLIKQVFGNTKAWQSGNFYDVAKTVSDGGVDYQEGRAAEPDVYLLDLISVLHPTKLQGFDRRFLRRVEPAEQTIVNTPSNCTDIEAPLFIEWTEEDCKQNEAEIDGLDAVKVSDTCDAKSPSAAPVLACDLVVTVMALFMAFMAR